VLIRIGPVHDPYLWVYDRARLSPRLWLARRQAGREGLSKDAITGRPLLRAFFRHYRIEDLLYRDKLAAFFNPSLRHDQDMEGGLVFYGGVIFAVPVAIWYAKKAGPRSLADCDVWAPSIAIGHAIGRLGCFCAGCCYGLPAAFPGQLPSATLRPLLSRGCRSIRHRSMRHRAQSFLNFGILLF